MAWIVVERNAAVAARQAVEARENALVLMQAERSVAAAPTAALAWLKRYRTNPDGAWVADSLAQDAGALGVSRHVFRFPAASKAVAVTSGSSAMDIGGREGLALVELTTGQRRRVAVDQK